MIDRALRKMFNAETAPPVLWEPVIHGSMSVTRPYFETRIRNAISNIPIELQHKYQNAGRRIILCRHLSDIENPEKLFPETDRFRRAHGYTLQDGFALHGRSAGIYFPYDGHIVIPQLPDDYYINLPFSKWLGHDIEFIVGHEIGHLFEDKEDTPERLYLDPIFIETCRQELAALSSITVLIKAIPNGANIVELFGDYKLKEGFQEIYANLFAGNTLKRGNTRLLLPRSAQLVQNDIDHVVEEYRSSFAFNNAPHQTISSEYA